MVNFFHTKQLLPVILDQVYSNTRVPTQIKKSQNESTRVNTCPTRVNTNQQESKTSQHESAQVNTYQHKSRSVLDESISVTTSPTRV